MNLKLHINTTEYFQTLILNEQPQKEQLKKMTATFEIQILNLVQIPHLILHCNLCALINFTVVLITFIIEKFKYGMNALNLFAINNQFVQLVK